MRACLVTVVLGLALLLGTDSSRAEPSAAGGGHVTEALPEHDASDPSADPVSASNLLEFERFWPFQAGVREPWKPPGGGKTLDPRFPGVLVRVEAGGRARIDFGRDGIHDVPLERSDVVDRANRVRLGLEAKQAPNFLYMVGPRLLDAGGERPRPFPYLEAVAYERFLLVFANVTDADFPKLVESLRPVAERDDLLTLVFPQGRVSDSDVRERLRAASWHVPFLYDHLSEGYTTTLLEAGTRPPAVMLVSDEGRLIHQGSWSPRSRAELLSALEGDAVRRAGAGGRTASAD